jgi:hypothetical protein
LENKKLEWTKPELVFIGATVTKGTIDINCEPVCTVGQRASSLCTTGQHASLNCYVGNHIGK